MTQLPSLSGLKSHEVVYLLCQESRGMSSHVWNCLTLYPGEALGYRSQIASAQGY